MPSRRPDPKSSEAQAPPDAGGALADNVKDPGPSPAEEEDHVADLSFSQAQTALELCLSQLQSSELDVEKMLDLYRRALNYANRCEALLDRVEQEVLQWDANNPDAPPEPFEP